MHWDFHFLCFFLRVRISVSRRGSSQGSLPTSSNPMAPLSGTMNITSLADIKSRTSCSQGKTKHLRQSLQKQTRRCGTPIQRETRTRLTYKDNKSRNKWWTHGMSIHSRRTFATHQPQTEAGSQASHASQHTYSFCIQPRGHHIHANHLLTKQLLPPTLT